MIRSLISLGIILVLVFLGATVPLGERTFFGHIKQIWSSEETQELVEEVKEKSGPMVERVKRGVKAGVEAAADSPEDGEADEPTKTAEKADEETSD